MSSHPYININNKVNPKKKKKNQFKNVFNQSKQSRTKNLLIRNRNLFLWRNNSAFPKKPKPLHKNTRALEKTILLDGILQNVARVLDDLQSQYFSFFLFFILTRTEKPTHRKVINIFILSSYVDMCN